MSAAIIGLAVRLPGVAGGPAFERCLREQRSTLGPLPPDRVPAGVAAPRGGLLEELDALDYRGLRISPKEAAWMEPAHRLLLELAHEAFADAGLGEAPPRRVGVFVHAGAPELLRLAHGVPEALDGYAWLGTSAAVAAHRISHGLDLTGPSLAVDAGCASGAVAVDLAIAALERGDCDLALVGAANVMLTSDVARMAGAAGMLSARGHHLALDAAGDGAVRSEGAVAVVLRRAAEVTPRERVYARVIGSAVVHRGRGDWLMSTHLEPQVDVVRLALKRARICSDAVRYAELHGAAQPRGDLLEVEALGAALASEARGPLAIGTIKALTGTLEGAGPLLGLARAAVALHRGVLPPLPPVERPVFDEAAGRVYAPREPLSLAMEDAVSVHAASYAGALAHVILAPDARPRRPAYRGAARLCFLLPTAEVQAWAKAEVENLHHQDGWLLPDLALTWAGAAKPGAPALFAGARAELVEALAAIAAGAPLPAPAPSCDPPVEGARVTSTTPRLWQRRRAWPAALLEPANATSPAPALPSPPSGTLAEVVQAFGAVLEQEAHPELRFQASGGDSLRAVELARRLSVITGRAVGPSDVLRLQTPAALFAAFPTRPAAEAEAPQPDPETLRLLEEIEGMSEDEIAAALAREG